MTKSLKQMYGIPYFQACPNVHSFIVYVQKQSSKKNFPIQARIK